MKIDFRRLMEYMRKVIRTPRGKDALMFLLFLVISVILWSVMSLNDDVQADVRMPLRITHVPDSVTLISPGPENLSVSLTARGTQLLKLSWGDVPTVDVDFRQYRNGSTLFLTNTDLKSLARSASGGSQVSLVYPDSLNLPFTTHPGYVMPVVVDYKVTAGPQSALVGRPKLSCDTVRIFLASNRRMPSNLESVSTEPIRINSLDKTTTEKVRLIAPPGSRLIPDSVDVTFTVEPLIMKSRKVVIEPVNVPDGVRLITFPSQIEVFYMVPMSAYADSHPQFRVLADYRRINRNAPTRNMRLRLIDVPETLQNVHLSADSAEYIIQK